MYRFVVIYEEVVVKVVLFILYIGMRVMLRVMFRSVVRRLLIRLFEVFLMVIRFIVLSFIIMWNIKFRVSIFRVVVVLVYLVLKNRFIVFFGNVKISRKVGKVRMKFYFVVFWYSFFSFLMFLFVKNIVVIGINMNLREFRIMGSVLVIGVVLL